MVDTVSPLKTVTVSTSLVDIGDVVASGKVRSIDLRCTNIGAADGYADVYMVDTNNSANNHYRAKNYPVPFQQLSSAPDLENGLLLTAGWKVQVRASAASTLAFSLTTVEDDA